MRNIDFLSYFTGKHLSSLEIYPSDTRDQYLRGTFHGYSLQNLLWGVIRPDSYFTRAVYPTKRECCSPISVTFSVSEPDKMHMLNYLLYHLHVFDGESKFGNIPAKMQVPEDNVSRYVNLILINMFNQTASRFYCIHNEK